MSPLQLSPTFLGSTAPRGEQDEDRPEENPGRHRVRAPHYRSARSSLQSECIVAPRRFNLWTRRDGNRPRRASSRVGLFALFFFFVFRSSCFLWWWWWWGGGGGIVGGGAPVVGDALPGGGDCSTRSHTSCRYTRPSREEPLPPARPRPPASPIRPRHTRVPPAA